MDIALVMEKSNTPLSTPLDIYNVDDKQNLCPNGVECHICMRSPTDVIATPCGHIFCWPCIYKWLQNEPKPCPVCRITLTQEMSVLALYGFDTSTKPINNKVNANEEINVIPPRPPNPMWFISPDLHQVTFETNIEGSSHETNYATNTTRQTNWLFRELQKERDLRCNLTREMNQTEQRNLDLIRGAQESALQLMEEIDQMTQAKTELELQLAQAKEQLVQAMNQRYEENDKCYQAIRRLIEENDRLIQINEKLTEAVVLLT